ncbi:MAG: DUF4374 domain-containing protein [Candidatus Symbiothrix sp.]|jgi:hypothetical protein|nr:DUF4374 domain-containing protein [Candidatus Symbiothrix sp.]
MKKNIFLGLMMAIGVCVTSCSESEDNVNGEGKQVGAYIVAASSEEASYLLQTNELNSGNLTIVNSGLETETATAWVFHGTKYAYRLVYNQGNAGTGSSYVLNTAGNIEERSVKFEITNRFTTYGPYDKYIVTAAAGATALSDATGKVQQGVTFTILDTDAQTLKTKTISTENFLGTGEYTTFSGIVERNGKLFSAVCPIGVSEYGVAHGVSDTVRSTTAYPDSVWVAIYDNINLENPKIIRDNRLSYASSRYRSQYYSTIAADDKNNLYVFSSAYDSHSSKKSGVIRINAGTEVFDKDYYFDIEAASGGIHLFKVWHVTGDYFLLQMYTTPTIGPIADARKLAIFNVASKSFTWVTGLPAVEAIGNFGSTPLADKGVIYMPVVTTDGNQPAVYAINPISATATKGVVVTSSSISALGKLTN